MLLGNISYQIPLLTRLGHAAWGKPRQKNAAKFRIITTQKKNNSQKNAKQKRGFKLLHIFSYLWRGQIYWTFGRSSPGFSMEVCSSYGRWEVKGWDNETLWGTEGYTFGKLRSNLEPNKWRWMEDDCSFSIGWCLGSMLIFRGVLSFSACCWEHQSPDFKCWSIPCWKYCSQQLMERKGMRHTHTHIPYICTIMYIYTRTVLKYMWHPPHPIFCICLLVHACYSYNTRANNERKNVSFRYLQNMLGRWTSGIDCLHEDWTTR